MAESPVISDGEEAQKHGLDEKTGAWFVYDGECPLCNSAAHAFRIKKEYGSIHLIDARTCTDDPLIDEINERGLDLDEGMIIYARGQFYHGEGALKFMAQYGDASNAFMALCKSLYWSNTISSLTYPWVRGTRNWLLRRRGIGRIDNLKLKNEPVFKSVFGSAWDELPTVLQKHYANRPYSNDITIVEGILDVRCKQPLRFLAPFMKFMGQIPAYTQKNVPVTVRFQSERGSKAFQFNRVFHFDDAKPYGFRSRMVQIKGGEMIEIMRFKLGWRMHISWDGEKVVLKHKGYTLQIFGHFIPLPLTYLMGAGYAEEVAVDDEHFDMLTHIIHPWWGEVYGYKGRFKLVEGD
ncbi:MAG: DUF4166 domain-containing protein [Rhizobiaceae bacterium]|nr:DUF4166 domain-containing protein [Rhizobiaceae bacterium]